MNSIGELFASLAGKLIQASVHPEQVSPQTVFQQANMTNRPLVHKTIAPLLLPGSAFENVAALLKLAELSRQGASCLILMEHYSNFDIPNLYYVLEKTSKEAEEASNQIVSMAGQKLNAEHALIRSVTEAYSRIVIFPSRSLDALRAKGEAAAEEVAKGRKINMAALHEMVRAKHAGHIILVFPAGTRYRPGDPETKRGLKEIDSYIKSFDHLLFVGLAGNTLRIGNAGEQMMDDALARDVVIFAASDVESAAEFRDNARAKSGPSDDPKQVVADEVMTRLEKLHQKADEIRKKRLPADAKV